MVEKRFLVVLCTPDAFVFDERSSVASVAILVVSDHLSYLTSCVAFNETTHLPTYSN